MKLPQMTKAAILVSLHKPLIVADVELPRVLAFGQVLVEVEASTICGSQLNEIDGAKGMDHYLPHLLGHEAVGKVLSCGTGVTSVRVGDRVVLHWRQGKGIDAPTPNYSWRGLRVNAGRVTTFQKYTVVSENRVTTIPKTISTTFAPLLGCAVTTAMGVVNNDAGVKIGQSVVVFGTGGVGLSIIQMASLVSAYPIVGIDLHSPKLTMAKRFGASHVLRATEKNLDEKIQKIVGSSGADVVIDTTGNTKVISRAYNLTHADGKTILVGVPKIGDLASIYTLPLHFKKTLKGSHGGSSNPTEDIPRAVRLLEAGKLHLKGLITHEFPLEKINKAIALVRQGTAGRVLLRMSP